MLTTDMVNNIKARGRPREKYIEGLIRAKRKVRINELLRNTGWQERRNQVKKVPEDTSVR